MPYRSRSDVWYNAPGAVAAWQPVGAPDPLAARVNVSNDGRLAGRHTATPVNAPAWSPVAGWTFTAASTQYMTTGCSFVVTSTALVMIAGWSGFGVTPFGANSSPAGHSYRLYASQAGGLNLWVNRNSVSETATAGMQIPSVYGLAGLTAYRNSTVVGTISSGMTDPVTLGSYIGANNSNGTPNSYFNGRILALLISNVTLSHAAVVNYSRQMTYCNANPDWSAWGRRRRYYYAPSLLAAMRRRMPGEVRVGSRGIIE